MLQKIELFLTGNKVFILGLLGAIGTAIAAFIGQTINYEVLGLAALIGGLSYAAKTLTGKIASIVGLLGSSVATIYTALINHGSVSWQQLILTLFVGVITVVSGSASSTKTLS